MDIKNLLEYPKIHIKSNINEIDLFGYEKFEKTIHISSDGEKIRCTAMCNNKNILFDKETFETDFDLKVIVNLNSLKAGDEIKTEIKIISTTNDLIIPVKIRVTAPFLVIKQNKKLYDLNDFYNYLLKNEKEALKLFYTEQFKIWIKCLDEKYLSIYNLLITDENARRCVENFLVLNEVKERVTLSFSKKVEKINVVLDDDKLEGFITVIKSGQGYFENDLVLSGQCDFIKFEQSKITSDNFLDNDEYKFKYYIDKSKFKNDVKETISFKNNSDTHILEFKEMPMFNLHLPKDLYKNGELGYFEIENNYNEDLTVIIDSNYIILKDTEYKLKKKKKIIFNVKPKGKSKEKQPFKIGEIKVQGFYKNKIENKNVKFKIDLTS